MKKFLLLLSLILVSCSQDVSRVHETWSWDGFRFFSASDFDILYDSWATRSVRDLYTTGSTLINGSYFGVTASGVYFPAWLWMTEGKTFSDLMTDDPNLTHVISQCDRKWSIISNEAWLKSFCTSWYARAFQAGPLVINEWQIAWDFGNSWHASGKYERTLLGLDHATGQMYFFVFSSGVSLKEASKNILADPLFSAQNSLDVINLDGWPSTAYYDGEKWFRENEKLPIIFRIKK